MTPIEMETAIIALQRENAGLKSRVSALELNFAPRTATLASAAARPSEPEGARILYPTERAPIAMPSAEEMQKLLDVVFATYPGLRSYSPTGRYAHQDAAEFFQAFCAAFNFVAHKGRAEEIDQKHSVGWWAFEASEWSRVQKMPVTISSGPLLAAVIAAGDVRFVQSDQYGNIWAFALATFAGRPATEAWRNVLRGQLLPPLPGAHKAPAGERFTVRAGQ